MRRPIVDLHCDLLSYLSGGNDRSPNDSQVRCSIPQMRDGNVRLQILAIFTETGVGSSEKGLAQADAFKVMLNVHSADFDLVQVPEALPTVMAGKQIGILAAFENASGFCEESEPLAAGLERLRRLFGKVGRPFYVGLTWNSENRFGGGALTEVGLKDDGKKLLEFLHGKQIALDLSHASDALAYDVLNFTSAEGFEIPVLASHSNVRKVVPSPRNLPDELIREIFLREGLIGINFVRGFVGSESDSLARHVEYLIQMGGENHIAFGADFFYDKALPENSPGWSPDGYFFPEYSGSHCYSQVLGLLQKQLSLSDELLSKIANENGCNFLTRLWHAPEPAISC